MPVTEGLITRRRITVNKIEESIIDYFVVCERIMPFVQKLLIDEQKKYVLTSFVKRKGVISVKDSDHHTMILDLSLKFRDKCQRIETYNVRERKSQMAFQINTSKDSRLSDCFTDNKGLETEGQMFNKIFFQKFNQSFKKVRRVNKVKDDKVSKLISSRNSLLQTLKVSGQSEYIEIESKIQILEKEICSLVEEDNFKRFSETFGPLMKCGGDTNNSIWKV